MPNIWYYPGVFVSRSYLSLVGADTGGGVSKLFTDYGPHTMKDN